MRYKTHDSKYIEMSLRLPQRSISQRSTCHSSVFALNSLCTWGATRLLLISIILLASSSAWAWSGALDGTIEVGANQAQLIGSGTYQANQRLSFIASCRLPGSRRGVLQLELEDHAADGSLITLPAQALSYTEFSASGQSLINGYASMGFISVTSTRSGAVIEVNLSAEITSELHRRALSNVEVRLIDRAAAPEERDPYDALITQSDFDDGSDEWFGCDGIDQDLIDQRSDYYGGEDDVYDVNLEYEGYYEEVYTEPESSYQSESLWGDDDADSSWFEDDEDFDEYDDSGSDESGCDSEDDTWESDEFAVEAAPRAAHRARLRSPRVWHLVSRLIPIFFSLLLIRIWRRLSA